MTVPTVPFSKPPFVAATLLRWTGPRDEAIAGDLLEAYRSGRSRPWFWRQVIAAILIGALTEVRSHKLVAVRAAGVGWIAGWVYFQYLARWVGEAAYMVVNFDDFLFATGLNQWFYLHGVGFPGLVATFVGPITTSVGCLLNGWTVGYFHRAHGPSMVVAYVALFSAIWIVPLSWHMLTTGGDPAVFSIGAHAFVFGTVPAMIGGLCGARRKLRRARAAAFPS